MKNLNPNHYACFECIALLKKSYDFIKIILKAQDILKNICGQHKKCDYEVTSAINHWHHYLIAHSYKEYPYHQEKEFICHICSITKTNITYLKSHIETHGKRNYECDICHRKFYTKSRIQHHLVLVHGTEKLICDYCSKRFSSRIDIIRHIRVHTGEKPFKCHIFSAGFAHKGNIGIHIRTKHQNYPIENKKKTKNKTIQRRNGEKRRGRRKK
ncbi:zinc finger protein 69 homolog isoform X2 [Galleria mellonella]|uniref:Zinc finger protein 69 homolog isoform X2 n=1 Tax=Galleria mellonella TaxID=7137 RepID=A0ABM3MRM4_GALME|nr:zinc finger protein 69 homolog isoform X2 [Galleria mellonella]